MPNLTKRIVDAAKPGASDYFVWCGQTAGFGVRVYPSGKKVFVAQVRVGRATRRVKIGSYGPFTVDQARTDAIEVIRSASQGRDPAREKAESRSAITVQQLCEAYLGAARAGLVTTRFHQPKRPSTVDFDQGRVDRHIVPLIGKIVARSLRRAEVQLMVDAIAQGHTAGVFKGKLRGKAVVTGGAGTAARVVGLLGGIYTWAERRELVPGPNPVRGIETDHGKPKDRTLNEAELLRLGQALDDAARDKPLAATAIRLIALTGLRRGEACKLLWQEIDELGQCLRLGASKTGRSVRPIGKAPLDLLLRMDRSSPEWVFPSANKMSSADLKKQMDAIYNAAGLSDARSHDLRRTFASTAADEGYSDATIGELLGHAHRSVTAKHYIRRPDAALIAAANRTSELINRALSGTAPASTIAVAQLQAS